MRQKSVMQNRFATVPTVSVQRSRFNRSHDHKTTFDAGLLIPIFQDLAYPGDTFDMSTNVIARLATPIYPIMDNVYLDIHYFAVPMRLVWDNFQKFMGEQVDPGDSTDYTIPTMDFNTNDEAGLGSPANYLGIPFLYNELDECSALPFRAMHLIWNEWYRDENLQDSLLVDKGDASSDYTDYKTLLPRGKRRDYFTACLPWPQKGDAVNLPLGSTAPLVGTLDIDSTGSDPLWTSASRTDDILQNTTSSARFATGTPVSNENVHFGSDTGLEVDLTAGHADLSGATAATINSIREAFQLQKMLERDARGGTRYVELIKSHFGVTSPDFRLQRPEYLGGGTLPLNVQQVAQTSAASGYEEVGKLGAYGYAQGRDRGFVHSFTEHCIVIGFMSARADLTYQQGIERDWLKSTREDFYFPSLAHLGEQEVLSKEIYWDGSSGDDDVFGYQERWAEMRYKPSKITGLFNSSIGSIAIDEWHLSQEFGDRPTLGDTFIKEDPPIDRVIAVPSEPHFICDMYFDYKCTRPMPTYSIPGYVDHF